MLQHLLGGFWMALADSVPGVSGGTVAFLLGFYDQFIEALNSVFCHEKEKRMHAIRFLGKLGMGWIIGFTHFKPVCFVIGGAIVLGMQWTKMYRESRS